jgi:DNA-binding MarR family transcriptional regulator
MSAPDPGDSPSHELVDHIIADLRAAIAELRCIGSERLVRQGVSMGQVHVMSLVERHGEMPMSRLAELLDVSLSNATGLIDRMEERELVERVRATDDRRVVTVRLTPHGHRTLNDLDVMRDELLQKILHCLDEARLRRLAAALEDVKDAVTQLSGSQPGLFAHDHAPASHAPGGSGR